MVRRILLIAIVALMIAPLALEAQRVSFVIVTRTGAQIPAAGPPSFDKNMVLFRTPRGTPLSMNLANLDVEQTEYINGVDLPVKMQSVQQAVARQGTAYDAAVVTNTASAEQTITNSDLRQLRTGRNLFTETGADAPEVGMEQQAVERRDTSGPPLNEAEWRTRARTIKNRQKELNRKSTILQDEKKRYERGMVGMDASQTQKLGKELDRVNQELDSIRQELSLLQRQWKVLTDEARAQGVPDEWIN